MCFHGGYGFLWTGGFVLLLAHPLRDINLRRDGRGSELPMDGRTAAVG